MLWQSDVGDADHRHGVQFFRPNETTLEERVGVYLAEALDAGASVVAVTSPHNVERFLHRLDAHGIDVRHFSRAHRINVLDAQTTLDALFATPNVAENFERIVGDALQIARNAAPTGRVRAYGDMVGLLWQQDRKHDLSKLEDIWNEALQRERFDLLCGYPIDVLGSRFCASELDAILRTHSHVVPAGSAMALEDALDRALEETLGGRADGIRRLVRANTYPGYPRLPRAEATILWLRDNLKAQADAIVALANRYVQTTSSVSAPCSADSASSTVAKLP